MKVVPEEEKKKHWISFRIDDHMYKRLKKTMAKSGMSIADLSRMGLKHIIDIYLN